MDQPRMSIALEDATEALRHEVMEGRFPPGNKLREVTVAKALGVSRTIARLAMSQLEHEGLLVREPNRGSRVRAFSIEQIADAIEVRGELEGMAVRLAAEKGLDQAASDRLEALLEESESLLASVVDDDDKRARWIGINEEFHALLIEASGNWALAISIPQVSALPLVSSSIIIFDRRDIGRSQEQLKAAHEDHRRILTAVQLRQGHRAEAQMREHAFKNAQNKRSNLTDPEALSLVRSLPGGRLIV